MTTKRLATEIRHAIAKGTDVWYNDSETEKSFRVYYAYATAASQLNVKIYPNGRPDYIRVRKASISFYYSAYETRVIRESESTIIPLVTKGEL